MTNVIPGIKEPVAAPRETLLDALQLNTPRRADSAPGVGVMVELVKGLGYVKMEALLAGNDQTAADRVNFRGVNDPKEGV